MVGIFIIRCTCFSSLLYACDLEDVLKVGKPIQAIYEHKPLTGN